MMTRFGWMAVLLTGGLATLLGLLLSLAGVTALRALFVGVNMVTILCYAYDKLLSRFGGWRVPEVALHLLAAAGGTPGALAGQALFRHKTRDRRFRAVFAAIVCAQAILILAYACAKDD